MVGSKVGSMVESSVDHARKIFEGAIPLDSCKYSSEVVVTAKIPITSKGMTNIMTIMTIQVADDPLLSRAIVRLSYYRNNNDINKEGINHSYYFRSEIYRSS